MSDLQTYWEIMQDKETKKGYMSTPKDINEARKELIKKIKRSSGKNAIEYNFAIEVNKEFAGYAGIHELKEKPLTSQGAIGTLGYALHPKFRGKGITTKAAKIVVDCAFKKYKNIKRISGRCRSFNKASARVMEKLGFTFEGKHRKEILKNGKYYDNLYYAKIR